MAINYANAATAGLGGAASGAAIGSAFPGYGTAIGAGVGGAAGILASIFGDQGSEGAYKSRYSPKQDKILNLLSQLGLKDIQGNGIENKAVQDFQTQTVPSIAELFTSMGSGGQSSSAFRGALGQAGVGLQTNLAALRQNRALNLLQLGLGDRNDYHQRQPGFGESLGINLLGGLPAYSSLISQNYQQRNQQNQQKGSGDIDPQQFIKILQMLKQYQGAF